MSVTRNSTLSLPVGGVAKTVSFGITADGECDYSFQVAADATAEEHVVEFTNAKLQQIFISSDQPITIKTNSSGSPQDTLNVAANVPFLWSAGGGFASPFAGNVTALYIANPASVAANLVVSLLQNT